MLLLCDVSVYILYKLYLYMILLYAVSYDIPDTRYHIVTRGLTNYTAYHFLIYSVSRLQDDDIIIVQSPQ
jgi:hypothetical protein